MPVIVLLDVQVKSDDLDAAHAAIHTTLTQTRAFAGAISLEVLADTTDPSKLTVVETWESAEAHDAYTAWRATDEGMPHELISVVAAPPVSRVLNPLPGV